MVKRTIEVSRDPVHLALREGQMLVLKKDDEPSTPRPRYPANLAGSIPCEDIGMVVVDQRQTTYTHPLLAELCHQGAGVVICGDDHAPVGVLLPFATHSTIADRLDAQINATEPKKKRLWQQLVIAKIRAQAAALRPEQADAKRGLLALAIRTRSGDPDNIEAQAARAYWSVWLAACERQVIQPFYRVAEPLPAVVPPPNNLLNYGYAILRAAVARAIISAGMLPALGIHHRGRANHFALADDLMEPLRPMIDRRVRQLWNAGADQLTQPVKAALLHVLSDPVTMHGTADAPAMGPLMVALHRYTASFARALAHQRVDAVDLDVPVPAGVELTAAERFPGSGEPDFGPPRDQVAEDGSSSTDKD